MGHILDVQTGQRRPIQAEDTGLVLFLRVDAVVSAGDSLGGICAVNAKTIYRP